MVFVDAKVFLPLLAALTALAAPVDDVSSNVSPAADVSVESDPVVDIDVDAMSLLAPVTPMTSAQVDAFAPYTYYTSAGYCNPSVTRSWTCGANCNANPGFRPIASGGDGSVIQFCSCHFYDSPLTVVLTVGVE